MRPTGRPVRLMVQRIVVDDGAIYRNGIGNPVRDEKYFIDHIRSLNGRDGRLLGKPLADFFEGRLIIGIGRSAIPDMIGQFVYVTLEFVNIVLSHGELAVFECTGMESDQLDIDGYPSLSRLGINGIDQVIQRFHRGGQTCIAVVKHGVHRIGHVEHQRQIVYARILDAVYMALVADDDIRTASAGNRIGMNPSDLHANRFQMHRLRHDVSVAVGHRDGDVMRLTLCAENGI